jgi:hypothetical protein
VEQGSSDAHQACITSAQQGCEQAASMVSSVVSAKLILPAQRHEDWAKTSAGTLAEEVWSDVKPALDQLVTQYRIPSDDLRKALRSGWSTGAEKVATAEPMHADRYCLLNDFYRVMGFTDRDMYKSDGFFAGTFSALLWSAMVYGDPAYIANVPHHPFNLKTGEVAVMYFGSVVYSKETVSRSRQGAYSGLSVPLGHGIYYHFGGFKGINVDRTILKEIDYGGMLVATKHLYFGGPHTTFRIPYEHVISFQPLSSGIGVCRDGDPTAEVFTVLEANPQGGDPVNARPLTGWFLYNMTHALAQPGTRTLYVPQP